MIPGYYSIYTILNWVSKNCNLTQADLLKIIEEKGIENLVFYDEVKFYFIKELKWMKV